MTSYRTYRALAEGYTPEEHRQYAQAKRFVECLRGDPAFRRKLEADADDPAIRQRLERIGVTLDPNALRPLWVEGLLPACPDFETLAQEEREAWEAEADAALDRWPLLKLWAQWSRDVNQLRFFQAGCSGDMPMLHPGLRAWRQRQITACKSELGSFARWITYPVFAYELCSGCSVGCWFCGFASKKLTSVCSYNDYRGLWNDILRINVDLFGPIGTRGLCYYATDPNDNPDYFAFLMDLNAITGSVASTSTANPLGNLEQTEQVLDFYRKNSMVGVRFSVTSIPMLRRIHDTYSPDELQDVELLLQMRHIPVMKARSGRTLGFDKGRLVKGDDIENLEPKGSIACVTGFIVNLAEGVIRLVSPCTASQRWPLGYRIFAEARFTDTASYREALQAILDSRVFMHAPANRILGFRDDLAVRQDNDSIRLTTPHQEHIVDGQPWIIRLAQLVAEGRHTLRDLSGLLGEEGVSPLAVSATVGRLFEAGLLDETPGLGPADPLQAVSSPGEPQGTPC